MYVAFKDVTQLHLQTAQHYYRQYRALEIFFTLYVKLLLFHSCGRPYIRLSHGEGSLDKGDRIPRSGMGSVLFI